MKTSWFRDHSGKWVILTFTLSGRRFLIPINKWKCYNLDNSNYVWGKEERKVWKPGQSVESDHWFSRFLMILTDFWLKWFYTTNQLVKKTGLRSNQSNRLIRSGSNNTENLSALKQSILFSTLRDPGLGSYVTLDLIIH